MTDARPARRVVLGGVPVDLRSIAEVLAEIRDRVASGHVTQPLAIASANLDHVFHFGRSGADLTAGAGLDWLVLLDGSPLVRRASALTGRAEALLTGADLLPHLLDVASDAGASVCFLGGTAQTHERLVQVLADRVPGLKIAGCWSPPPSVLDDPAGSVRVAGEIAGAGADILVVGLGKPRQEYWIQRYGPDTKARVFLAFGAAADFLAGTATRAPAWIRSAGCEWAYRLIREPRRLGRRYCLQGPTAIWLLWIHSYVVADPAVNSARTS